MKLLDAFLGRGEFAAADPSPQQLIGFSTTGGIIPAGVTATTALGLSSVWRCLDILANGISQLPWIERLGNLELPPSRLVRNPQDPSEYTRREWVSLVVSTMALYDIVYLLKAGGTDTEGVPAALVYLQPGICQPTTSDFGSFNNILPPTEFIIGNQRIGRDRLVILRRSPQPGVSDALSGVIHLARITFAAAISAEGYASRYWQAGGPPTTVLTADGPINDTLAQSYSERWQAMRQLGPDYAAVLGNGLKAQQFGADPTLQSAVEARREQVADIGRYFGIPTRILNAPTGDSETYTSTSAANMDLVRYTLRNYIGAIEDAITSQLPEPRAMKMDTWQLTEDTQLAQAQAYQLATGGKAWIDVDEVRDRQGLPPVESPDKLNPPVPVPVIAGGSNGEG